MRLGLKQTSKQNTLYPCYEEQDAAVCCCCLVTESCPTLTATYRYSVNIYCFNK